MLLFLLSMIPVVLYWKCRHTLSYTYQRLLGLACIPFAVMLAAYSLVLVFALIALWALKTMIFGSSSRVIFQSTRLY